MDNNVRHPVPAPPSPHFSMASSVERLEESAERMSQGSDITGEIRRIGSEQKRRGSNKEAARTNFGPTRKRSSNSINRSINDVNSTARRSDFSSIAYVPSSHRPFISPDSDTGMTRQDMNSGWPLYHAIDGPQQSLNEMQYNESLAASTSTPISGAPAPSSVPPRRTSPSQSASRPPLSPLNQINRHVSSSSTSSRRYRNYQHTSAHHADRTKRPSAGTDTTRPMLAARVPQTDVDRSTSTGSKSTSHHAASLFRDFDGIHYSPLGAPVNGYVPYDGIVKDEGEEDGSEDSKPTGDRRHAEISPSDDMHLEQHPTTSPTMHEQSQTVVDTNAFDIDFDKGEDEKIHEKLDILPVAQSDMRWAEPPPSENMVYYPAPVPTSLNLPKRISQQPLHMVSAMRRSQILGSMPAGARQSVLSLSTGRNIIDDLENPEGRAAISESEAPRQQRQSVLNFTKLPPQLRASVFFDHESVPHRIEVKDGSAVATLDRLLDASARAPADHSPKDLDLSGGATPKGHKRGKSSGLSSLFDHKMEAGKSRMSLLPFKKFSSGKTAQLEQDGRIKDDDPIDSDDDQYQSNDHEADDGVQQEDSGGNIDKDIDESVAEDVEGKIKPGMPSLEEQYLATPNTLLAELQSRKQQLRSRNRTAATSFPNGMHSTLLELDAVEQIEKKRRQAQKTSLAWEDPMAVTARRNVRDDEDVPLAVLFPTKHGLANKAGGNDWDRPLGLFEKKHIEESEPLSKRRNRLLGFDRSKAPDSQTQQQQQQITDDGQHSENEDETLAQRTRRLKSTKALDDAIGNTKSDAFASDMISQFGGVDQMTQDISSTDREDAEVPEDETLGQRRLRLQAQANKSAQQSHQPQSSRSQVNNLASAPANTIRQISSESNPSDLLGMNAQAQFQSRSQIILHNQHGASNLPVARPLKQSQSQQALTGLVGASQQWQDAKRMTRHDQNQRALALGFGAPATGQHMPINGETAGLTSYRQQKQQAHMDPRMNANGHQAQLLHQTQSFTASRFNDGSGGIRASAMPTMNHPSSSNLALGATVPGYGQQRLSTMSPYGQVPAANQQPQYLHYGMPVQQSPMQNQYQVPQMPMQTPQQAYDELMMTTKQRENIDRWRQSVMPS